MALNAVLASGVCTGESVAVFGLGVIGLLTTQLLISQAAEVLAVDTVPYRLELAAKFGATPFSTSRVILPLRSASTPVGEEPTG